MYYSVANFPLGGLNIERNPQEGTFQLSNPKGYDPNWLGLKMLDFYGNWNNLHKLATLTYEDTAKMIESELKNLGIEKLDEEVIQQKREEALKNRKHSYIFFQYLLLIW